MTTTEKLTFCRLCEQLCGLTVTVEADEIVKIRADREHPVTRGFACPKGLSANEIQADPDRVVHPLRRRGDGTFEQISWERAFAEIGVRLRGVIGQHGPTSVGMYLGNPAAFSSPHVLFAKGLLDALGTPHFYTSGSQDTNSRFVASHFLYGSPFTVPIPDLPRTDFLLMVGANPFVSHGSLVAGGLIRVDLQNIVERGGRVVVVDPRKTETAERFEHVAVRPDGDAWLLLGMLHVLFAENLVDPRAYRVATGIDELRTAIHAFTPELAESQSGVAADDVRQLARDLAAAPRAAVYGRVGACLGKHATLVNFLLDALNVVTGNLDRPGGSVFATPAIDFWATAKKQGLDTYASHRTRIGGYPEVGGIMPAGVMAEEILTPGTGQVRALIVSAGNPALSVPNAELLATALKSLDLMISIDCYVNETNATADYILPAATFLEREDVNLFVQPYQYRPFVQWTDRVVPPRGEAREEWMIYRDIAAQLGVVPSSSPELRRLGRIGRAIRPTMLLDAMLRLGPAGDRFGLRRTGLSRRKLINDHPQGMFTGDAVVTGVLADVVSHSDGRAALDAEEILADIASLYAEAETGDTDEYPLRLFGRRELKSLNSWMHNSKRLNPRTRPPSAFLHPDDAVRFGLTDGEDVIIESTVGSVTVKVATTDTVVVGSLCLPHGFGHVGTGGWQRANATGGANFNALTASGAGTLERLAAMSILNGVRVRVRAAVHPAVLEPTRVVVESEPVGAE